MKGLTILTTLRCVRCLCVEPTVVMTPLPQTPKIENSIVNMLPLDVSEQKMWWQLEEVSLAVNTKLSHRSCFSQ